MKKALWAITPLIITALWGCASPSSSDLSASSDGPPSSPSSSLEPMATVSEVGEPRPSPQSDGAGGTKRTETPKASSPSPPKPSLQRLTNRDRPYLEFAGTRIYADTVFGTTARGHVYLDGSQLHQQKRSFPIAAFAETMKLDAKKGQVTLSGWPIVQTDSAYIQARSGKTKITLDQNHLATIDGPTKYVFESSREELFSP
ncbi:MAG: hypothetical protein AAF191_13185 [Verrucomicrobiota bacterium]